MDNGSQKPKELKGKLSRKMLLESKDMKVEDPRDSDIVIP